MPFNIIRNDITKCKTDAIVNAANKDLVMGAGVCGAIFNGAGVLKMTKACKKFAPIKTGEAVITPGFNLAAKHVIHTVGPIYDLNIENQENQLANCYINSLRLAKENNLESIAFPLISSGVFSYPKDEALRIASNTIKEFLRENEMDVTLVLYDEISFGIGEQLEGEIEEFIDNHYVEQHEIPRDAKNRVGYVKRATVLSDHMGTIESYAPIHSLEERFEFMDESFSEYLLKLIDKKGEDYVEVYKRANIDRRLFFKIRNNKGYTPKKRTVIAFAIALQLNIDETSDLLKQAGYALSDNNKFDVIIRYFILKGGYDIFEINEVLFNHDQPLLGF